MAADTDIDKTRFTNLEGRVVHLDTTVGKLMQNQASMDAKLETVISGMDKIATRVNQPHNTNWWGLISAIIAVVVVIAGGIQMKVTPIELAQLQILERIELDNSRDQISAENRGYSRAKAEDLQKQVNRLTELISKQK
jgi:hypothetical protein